MSPFAVKAIQLLMSLSLLIILHELGHFIPARIFKTRVEKFFLFFDVKFALFKKKIGETVYGIGWLPLGGYVKIAGMIDESMDIEQMQKPAQPWEFRSKPAWQRLIIMLGGVTVNLILGFLIYLSFFIKIGFEIFKKFKLDSFYFYSGIVLVVFFGNTMLNFPVHRSQEIIPFIIFSGLILSISNIKLLRKDYLKIKNLSEKIYF